MEKEKAAAMQEEFAAMIAEEERRLEEGRKEFMERHREIMGMIDDIRSRYRKNAPASAANTDKSE